MTSPMQSRPLVPTLLFVLAASCSGGGGDGPVPSEPELSFSFGTDPWLLRVGDTASAVPTESGAAASGAVFSVQPSLPPGLQLDASTGAIQGVPSASIAGADYVVTGSLAGESVEATVHIAVGAPLPSEIAHLEDGFEIRSVIGLSEAPSKMAVAPDGRIFVNQLTTGVVSVFGADGTPQGAPFATVPVVTGGHRGLLGVALSPDFETDRFVFAFACAPAGGGKPERSLVYRWTENAGVGQNETVILDDLPISAINNGGALCFDASGMLLVSVGDTEDPLAAQSELSLAGKILRVDPADGSVPPDNPDPSSHIWAIGMRNTYAMTLHPVSGSLIAADNGPADNDELNLLQPDRNYEWGAAPGASFGALTGPRLRLWPDVVVPTGLAFRNESDGLDWPEEFDRSLYLALYDEEIVERFEMSGSQNTDIDSESEFLRFTPFIDTNRPVDIVRGPQGRLWILTFTTVYCTDRIR